MFKSARPLSLATGPTAAEPVDDDYIAAHAPRLACSGRCFAKAQWQRTFEPGLHALIGAIERDGRALRRR